jgi:hypothetical protein
MTNNTIKKRKLKIRTRALDNNFSPKCVTFIALLRKPMAPNKERIANIKWTRISAITKIL